MPGGLGVRGGGKRRGTTVRWCTAFDEGLWWVSPDSLFAGDADRWTKLRSPGMRRVTDSTVPPAIAYSSALHATKGCSSMVYEGRSAGTA